MSGEQRQMSPLAEAAGDLLSPRSAKTAAISKIAKTAREQDSSQSQSSACPAEDAEDVDSDDQQALCVLVVDGNNNNPFDAKLAFGVHGQILCVYVQDRNLRVYFQSADHARAAWQSLGSNGHGYVEEMGLVSATLEVPGVGKR